MTTSIVIGCVREGKTRVPAKPPRLLYWPACYAPLGNACLRGHGLERSLASSWEVILLAGGNLPAERPADDGTPW